MKKNTYVVYGFATAILMVIVGSLILYSGATFRKGMNWLVEIPFFVGILLNAIAYSKANNSYVTFGSVFKSCFMAVLIIMAVRLAWIPVSDHLFPNLKEQTLANMREKMAKNPGTTDDQVDMITNLFTKFWGAIMILGVVIGTLFMGALYSVVAAAVAKKSDLPMPQGDNF